MDSAQQIVLTSFQERQATSARGPFTVYELIDTNGTKWGVKKNIYDQAIQMIGRPITAITTTKINGTYTNHYINAVAEMTGTAVPPPVVHPVQTMPQAAPTPQASIPQPTAPTPAIPDYETRKQASIHRQVAGKVAAQISKDPREFWGNVLDLYRYFESGVTPNLHAASEVAQAFPGATATAAAGDGIPFLPTFD